MPLFDRLKARLTRTRSALSDGISGLFRGGREMDAALLGELEELLYNADLGPIASEVVEELQRLHKRGELQAEDDVRAALRDLLFIAGRALDQAKTPGCIFHQPDHCTPRDGPGGIGVGYIAGGG